MQPLKMTIPGNFWDSQIYSGRLYLFGAQGNIITLDWDRLIEEWKVDKFLKLAMHCAFRRSDYLYGNRWSLLFSDTEVKSVIQKKFKRLAAKDLTVSHARLRSVTIDQQDTPFPFPHADTTIYYKRVYVASSEGVHSANCNKKTRYPISSRSEKHWDAPTLALSASYNNLALAAGDEGLFEVPLGGDRLDFNSRSEPSLLSGQNCIDCRWTFYSIYGSSHVASGYLAAFTNEIDQVYNRDNEDSIRSRQPFKIRKFDKIIDDIQIFQGRGYSWGMQDKLCQAGNGIIRIVKYTPWKDEVEDRFRDLGVIELAAWKGDVVSGGTAHFGTVIECNNALVVAPSEGDPITLRGEPVNWRIFPKSVCYENQLHVIYEDRLEILSFNHDYFVNQEAKRSGIQFNEFLHRSSRRGF